MIGEQAKVRPRPASEIVGGGGGGGTGGGGGSGAGSGGCVYVVCCGGRCSPQEQVANINVVSKSAKLLLAGVTEMYRTLAILLCLPLASCVLAEAGGASLAVEGAAVEGGAAGAMAMGEAEALGAAGRLMIAPEAASAAEAAFGPAMEELAAGRGALVVDGQGTIYAGSRAVASFEGETLVSGGRQIGELRDGYIYRTGGSDAVGRLHGSIPARGVTLTFADGTSVANVRPMLVDVLRFDQGQYLIRLADGSQAW